MKNTFFILLLVFSSSLDSFANNSSLSEFERGYNQGIEYAKAIFDSGSLVHAGYDAHESTAYSCSENGSHHNIWLKRVMKKLKAKCPHKDLTRTICSYEFYNVECFIHCSAVCGATKFNAP